MLLILMILMPWIFLIGIADKFNITSFPEALVIDLMPIILLIVFDIVLLIFAITRLRPFDIYTKIGFFVALFILIYFILVSIFLKLEPAFKFL